MIQRKQLVDYANRKKAQALRVTIDNKNYIYLEAINALCQCGFAIKANKKANITAFELSEKHFDSKYQFGYEQFLGSTIEANLAICYINVLSWAEMHSVKINFNRLESLPFYMHTQISCLNLIINEFNYIVNDDKMNKYVNKVLFQLEHLAETWHIDLHYLIDKTLSNMEYNLKNGI
jgi:hypothetical protein